MSFLLIMNCCVLRLCVANDNDNIAKETTVVHYYEIASGSTEVCKNLKLLNANT